MHTQMGRVGILLLALQCLLLADIARADGAKINHKAPLVTGKTLQQKPIHWPTLLARYDVIVLTIWGAWCRSCRDELLYLDKLSQRYRQQGQSVLVLGLNVNRDRDAMRRVVRKHGFRFPIIHDFNHRVVRRYAPATLPTTYLIDKQGIIRNLYTSSTRSELKSYQKDINCLLRQQRRKP